ncbi:UNVERIFIED_CONTAM: hypothetical protein GTU68_010598 [Idotea baltica]|nr:hypothetical protein [Idotea baltica]
MVYLEDTNQFLDHMVEDCHLLS